MKELELELTYLAKSFPPQLKKTASKRLTDVYIPQQSTFPILRLRQKGNSYEITKKIAVTKGDFSKHVEHTIPLSEDEYIALKNSSSRRVEKDRYTIDIAGNLVEIDVFLGDLTGLVLMDFEFKTEQAKNNFVPPDFCLADVTQENFILGGQLAGQSYADIEKDLDRFGYRKLAL